MINGDARKVVVNPRARVTPGLAKEVEEVVNGWSAFATGLAFVPMMGTVLPVNLAARGSPNALVRRPLDGFNNRVHPRVARAARSPET